VSVLAICHKFCDTHSQVDAVDQLCDTILLIDNVMSRENPLHESIEYHEELQRHEQHEDLSTMNLLDESHSAEQFVCTHSQSVQFVG
jgi:hypothetical protein